VTETGELPSVCVVVAAYNAEATLAACLDSLAGLDYPRDRAELVCVDNASTDTTARILAAYSGRVRACREPKRGPAAARNHGIALTRSDVVALTDADCTVDPAWLRHLVAPLAAREVGVAGGRILSRRPCNWIEAFGERVHDHARALQEFSSPYCITMNWAARREVLEAVGAFDPELLRASDVDWSWRLGAAGYRFAYVPEAIVYHRNERTPWGLVYEGYTHAVNAVPLRARHAGPLAAVRERPGETPPRAQGASPRHWSDPVWWALFNFGKRLGRAHAAWRNRSGEARAE
jgi:GT2 family glycosyltransferase